MRFYTKSLLVIAMTFSTLLGNFASFSQDEPSFKEDTAFENDPAVIARQVLDQTNQFRKSEGLAGLIDRDDLNEIAKKHSEDMAAGRVDFGHDGFEERNESAKKKIKSILSFAENVAYGAKSGNEAVAMWKKSSGHRRNMLGRYIYIGIGVAKDSKGQVFYTQIFAG